ncbi:MAG: AAA family ATPase [Defluviitaleaceae bacterium]|nr:AAA family ATPase [Defluviitaleaceae bacterium]MCL2835766.1 AAA family ATPase [Defluviitaleaceae bacterium]
MVELKYSQLKKRCNRKHVPVKDADTAQKTLIGQDKAAETLRFGLGIRERGFNIYASGPQGSGKTTFAAEFAREIAKNRPTPPDLCYIYNFKEPRYPKLLSLPAGMGRELRSDMEDFIAAITDELPREFNSNDFESKKHVIVKAYQEKRDKIIREITDEAREKDYGVKMTNTGVYFMPIIDGEMISEEQYNAMPQDEKDEIAQRTEFIQERAQEVMRGIREYERTTQKEVSELERESAKRILDGHIGPLLEKYSEAEDNAKAAITGFLEQVKEDALNNLVDFAAPENDDEEYLQNLIPLMSLMGKREKNETASKYHVNLLTDGSGQKGAPVIIDFNPTYANLIGEVEYDSEHGNLTTDFMMIKPGLLHRANGGFLVLQARDVFKNAAVWEALCKCLITGRLMIEPNREFSTGVAMAGLRPEPCEIDIKVVLIGPSFYYHILNDFDEEFRKLFKINAVFDYEMPYNTENIKHIAAFARSFGKERGLSFDAGSIQILVEHLSRSAERQDKLCTQIGVLRDILVEAAAYAEPVKNITAGHIKHAVDAREKRSGLYEEKVNDMIEQNIIMIDTDGKKTAQINGLAVFETGDHIFAKPARITATAYVGKAGIVNIEKEADMSGNIHIKGVQVIIGYLGQKYAQNFPLSLSCRVCFEQNYAGIDGDSASGAELVAVLSSLANVPIRQDLAITGSINQRGEIQAIGGVTYKIEGFFALCKQRGLTGKQGVIIPHVNIQDLTLRDEVAEAVKAGMFHIYAINHIDEAVRLLTGLEPGAETNGKYPPDTVHGLVYKKLKKFYKRSIGG